MTRCPERATETAGIAIAMAASACLVLAACSRGTPDSTLVQPEAPPARSPVADPVHEGSAPVANAFDAGASPAGPRRERHVVALMPLGAVPEDEVDGVAAALERYYGWEVRRLERRDLLASAYHAPRKRYRAEKLLSWLRTRKPSDAEMIMGLAEVDISTTKGEHEDWGICGLADIGGPASVVSTFRIKKKLGRGLDAAERRQRYERRLSELAAHEFGHQLGLDHCPNEGCIMEDAKGTVTTFNRSTGELCGDCRDALEEAGRGRIR
jgi:archaemetzincin